MEGFWKMVWYAVCVLVIVGLVVFGFWVRFAAPCKDIGWLPAKEMPGRCFTFVRN